MKKKDLPFWGIDFTPLRALVQNQNKQREQTIVVGCAGGVKSILEAARSLRHFRQKIKLLRMHSLKPASFREKRIAPGIPAPRGKIFSEQEANGPASAPPIPGWGGVRAIK